MNTNYLYTLSGFGLIALGLIIIIIQVKKIRAGRDDSLGGDYKLLAGGIGFVMTGIAIIHKYL